MSADQPLPMTVRTSVAVGVVEVVGLVAYAVALIVTALRGDVGQGVSGSATFPVVEVVVFLAFAGLVAAVVRGLKARRRVARTPFLVTQFFGAVVGWTLLSGDGGLVRAVGVAVIGGAIVGGVAILAPATEAALDQ